MAGKSTSNFLKTLGPGILFASTCIGVSHLVQSTRAGADFGFLLLWAVILANVLKYPFFEFASRYANVTGSSIIDGYKRLGKGYLILYFSISIGTMFFVTAAVGYTTSGFLQNLFGISGQNMALGTTAFLFFGSAIILILGQYNFLDRFIKIIGSILLISTIAAFIITLAHGPAGTIDHAQAPSISGETGFIFIIALMGWMPTAIDIASWNSLWTVERIKQTGYKPKLKETLLDFNLGYIISGVLSVCFLVMGAYLLFGSADNLPNNSSGFANGVIELYAKTMGEWSYYIIAIASFSIMLGTCIAIFDGYSRTLERCISLLFDRDEDAAADHLNFSPSSFYSFMVGILALGAFTIILTFSNEQGGFKGLVDFATTLSFIVAPVIAIFNLRLVLPPYLDKQYAPPKWKIGLAYTGIVILSLFTILFFLYKLGVINFM